MRVTLTEEFTLYGKLYGPGEIEVEDQDIANHLKAAEYRLFGKKRGDTPPVLPNAVMQQSVPRDQMPKAQPSNGTTMADIQKQTEDANKAAAEQQQKEQADAAAQGQPTGTSGQTGRGKAKG